MNSQWNVSPARILKEAEALLWQGMDHHAETFAQRLIADSSFRARVVEALKQLHIAEFRQTYVPVAMPAVGGKKVSYSSGWND